jgi:FKBP-type peptidyl-prolyl cis-trans isomerase FklB
MLKRYIVPAVATLVVLSTPLAAEEYTQNQKFSYTIGYQMGVKMRTSGTEVDPTVFAKAIQDGLSGSEPKMTPEEMQAAFQAERQAKVEEHKIKAEENLKKGQEFLTKNKDKEGVKTLPSGVQYEVIKEGTGKTPAAEDTVEVHYRGTLIDGKEFDSSYTRGAPATFKANGVIPGFKEALTSMKEGAHWKVYIPADQGYGERGAGQAIGPNETLIFDLELIAVKTEK